MFNMAPALGQIQICKPNFELSFNGFTVNIFNHSKHIVNTSAASKSHLTHLFFSFHRNKPENPWIFFSISESRYLQHTPVSQQDMSVCYGPSIRVEKNVFNGCTMVPSGWSKPFLCRDMVQNIHRRATTSSNCCGTGGWA